MDTDALEQLRAENKELRLRVEALEAEKAHRALMDAREPAQLGRLQRTLAELPMIVDIFDLATKRSIFKSRDLDVFLGYAPGALAAMGPQPVLFKIVRQEYVPRLVAFLERMFEGGEVDLTPVDYRVRRADGSDTWFRSEVRAFDRSNDGRLVTVLMVTYEITEAKVAEMALRALNAALSSPVLRVGEDILALPIIGAVDAGRAALMTETILGAIVRTRARFSILDLTGVNEMDSTTAAHIQRLVDAARLLGAEVVVCGIRPAVAGVMIDKGLGTSAATVKNLREALRYCVRRRRLQKAQRGAPLIDER